ncbi:hypothetical protein BP6252_02919 [Coleophoma cylindrospora]|uniref:Uncharacterized protein n=1 Tax=Coleophoma cylindrospora TaxID=1849047 RepID=A0A3D8SG52_9HELO|nr:hypothetical protein BP6252_02919 [Coleophoma cylindrospora]
MGMLTVKNSLEFIGSVVSKELNRTGLSRTSRSRFKSPADAHSEGGSSKATNRNGWCIPITSNDGCISLKNVPNNAIGAQWDTQEDPDNPIN